MADTKQESTAPSVQKKHCEDGSEPPTVDQCPRDRLSGLMPSLRPRECWWELFPGESDGCMTAHRLAMLLRGRCQSLSPDNMLAWRFIILDDTGPGPICVSSPFFKARTPRHIHISVAFNKLAKALKAGTLRKEHLVELI
ncbi:hypothetical protein E4U31_001106 [Claviceps sp. LM219 group G6]|nr:hypothetical protein E4U31_001106 [Claviceps sp. LM219 group G6]